MILLAVALLLQAAGTQAGQTEPRQSQGQPSPPRAYSGPHTLAKTWGDLYPGLRVPSKPVHAAGTGVKASAGSGVALSKPSTHPDKGLTSPHASGNREAAVGSYAAKTSVAGKGLPAAPSPRPVTSTAVAAPSAQMTFFDGANKTGDGRMDVMHFRDGKMAVTMGKDWNCSYANDQQQHRVVIICDGQRAHP